MTEELKDILDNFLDECNEILDHKGMSPIDKRAELKIIYSEHIKLIKAVFEEKE